MGVMAFAVAAAIASKYLFRVEMDGRMQHFMNPSNFGISLSIVLFPWIAPIPYIFTEHVTGVFDVLVPVVVLLLGFRLNFLFTRRIPLILSWLGAFVFQAVRALAAARPPLRSAAGRDDAARPSCSSPST